MMSEAHNPHLSALLTPSPFIKVEGKKVVKSVLEWQESGGKRGQHHSKKQVLTGGPVK
jgi:hypothetical protein